MVDWGLAERIARGIAGRAEAADWAAPPAVAEASERAADAVIDFTGLDPGSSIPTGESIGRADWIRVNLEALHGAASFIEAALDGEVGIPGPLGGLAGSVARRVVAAEAGAVLGYAAQRILGQYDVALIGPRRAPRLLYVAPNITASARAIGDGSALLEWIALHEATHALQFGATPWLEGHLSGLVEQLISSARPRHAATRVLEAAGSALTRDPRRSLRALREVGALGAILEPEQRALLGRLQAAMSAIEGYAEYTMDAAGATVGIPVAQLRAAMEKRRAGRGPLETLLARVLGVELKLRQYREGRGFADAVALQGGIGTLNLVFSTPEALPRPDELRDPDAWLGRVA